MTSTQPQPYFQRVALLIDAENIQPEHLDRLIKAAQTLGHVTVRRAYADWSRRYVQVWREALIRAAIRPFHHFAIANLKNGVDVAMTVDVMRLLSEEHPDAVVMASGDADMAALVMALREAGVYVMGFGTDQTNAAFRACFDKFESLGADTHPAVRDRREDAAEDERKTKAAPRTKRQAPASRNRSKNTSPPDKPRQEPPQGDTPPVKAASTETPPAPKPTETPQAETPRAPDPIPEAPVAELAPLLEAARAVLGKSRSARVSAVANWLMKHRPDFYEAHCKQGRISRKLARLPEVEVEGDRFRLAGDTVPNPAPEPIETGQDAPSVSPAADTQASAPVDETPAAATEDHAQNDSVTATLMEAVAATAESDGWTTVLAMGRWLSRERPEFHKSHCGKGRLTALVEQSWNFEVQRHGRVIRVRRQHPEDPAS